MKLGYINSGGPVNRLNELRVSSVSCARHSERSSAESRNLLFVRPREVEKQIPHSVRNDYPARLNPFMSPVLTGTVLASELS